MKENNNQGNPEAVDQAVFGSEGDDFFERMEKSVNGAIQDEVNQVTPPEEGGSEQVTHDQEGSSNKVDWDSEDNPYKKRYADSSGEAIRQREQMKDLEPFVPLLDAMKNDSGLVDHVRDYLTSGGKPAKNVQEKLGLSEDFVFDAHEAVSDVDSDSAKVMNAHVDGIVSNRVNNILNTEKQRAAQTQKQLRQKQEEAEFRAKHKMSDDEYNAFLGKAREHKLTLEDVNYLINRDKIAANTAKSTKEDMLGQMNKVRDIPTSLSGASNQDSKSQSVEDNVFDAMKGLDNDLDNLFG
tara:strand:- start:6677 stop:7561 length:885 start_codon:yes stop_codon:yes gene_type:complete